VAKSLFKSSLNQGTYENFIRGECQYNVFVRITKTRKGLRRVKEILFTELRYSCEQNVNNFNHRKFVRDRLIDQRFNRSRVWICRDRPIQSGVNNYPCFGVGVGVGVAPFAV
jgi:hypothetical protein